MKSYDVFLSHSSKDKAQVQHLAQDLQTIGVTVWLDEWEIRVGDSITQQIQHGLKHCQYIALWLTKHAVHSGWVQREWQAKYNQEIADGRVAVLPLLADECEIPALLRDKKYADFRHSYEEGFSALLPIFGKQPRPAEGMPQDSSNASASNPNDHLLSALRALKEHTKFLWLELTELKPWKRDCSAEIKETTLTNIAEALEFLASLGHFSYSTSCAYDILSTNERVMIINVHNISTQLINLVAVLRTRDSS